jgi:hypothetical protein
MGTMKRLHVISFVDTADGSFSIIGRTAKLTKETLTGEFASLVIFEAFARGLRWQIASKQ